MLHNIHILGQLLNCKRVIVYKIVDDKLSDKAIESNFAQYKLNTTHGLHYTPLVIMLAHVC